MTNGQLIIKYKSIQEQIRYYESDIVASEEALKDRFLDYMAIKELKDDIRYDNRMIDALKLELKEVIDLAIQMGVNLEPEETDVKKLKLED